MSFKKSNQALFYTIEIGSIKLFAHSTLRVNDFILFLNTESHRNLGIPFHSSVKSDPIILPDHGIFQVLLYNDQTIILG